MITVDQLENYSPGLWRFRAQLFEACGEALAGQAHELARTAAALRLAWPDHTGQLIAQNVEQQAEYARTASEKSFRAASLIESSVPDMVACQQRLVKAKQYCKNQHLLLTSSGSVYPDPGYVVQHPGELPALLDRSSQMTSHIRQILQRATVIDLRIVAALDALGELNLPYVDLGPIDFSADGIRHQADHHEQGPLGHCALLSPLMSIGRADPSFVQRNVQWDEQAQKYRVRLYDPDTGTPVEVLVDPRKLDDQIGMAADSRNPDYISIYQQAVKQKFPHDHFNFELTQKIVLGHAAPESTTSQTSFDDIRKAMATEPPAAIMVATPGAAEQVTKDTPLEARVAGGHAYSVVGFDDQGRIVLRNPWGADATVNGITYPNEVHMTEDEYRRYLNGITISRPPF